MSRRPLLHAGVACIAGVVATFLAVLGYLVLAGMLHTLPDAFLFALVITLPLLCVALPLSAIVGVVHAVSVQRNWLGRPLIIVLLAAAAGAALGAWASHGAPHVAIRLAIQACMTSWTVVALVSILTVQIAREDPSDDHARIEIRSMDTPTRRRGP